MEKTIKYNGRDYRHVASATLEELYKSFGHKMIESAMMRHDDYALARYIEKIGSTTPSDFPCESAIEVLDYTEFIMYIFCPTKDYEQYDLYKPI